MTCQWCGDRHSPDQLCQRAQRGMTRRSFLFLFGAGIAGTALAGAADPIDAWYVDTANKLHVQQADEWTVIEEGSDGFNIATFKSRDPRIRAGQRITIEFQGRPMFDGIVGKSDGERTAAYSFDAEAVWASSYRRG